MCQCEEYDEPVEGEDDDLSLPLDTEDPEFLRGFQIGQMWERLHHQPWVTLMVSSKSAEMVMRIAEKKRLPFQATVFDDEWTLASVGLAAELDPDLAD